MLGVSELKYTVTEKMSSPTHIFDKQWIELLYIWLVLLLALPSFFEALYARKKKQIMIMPFQKCLDKLTGKYPSAAWRFYLYWQPTSSFNMPWQQEHKKATNDLMDVVSKRYQVDSFSSFAEIQLKRCKLVSVQD